MPHPPQIPPQRKKHEKMEPVPSAIGTGSKKSKLFINMNQDRNITSGPTAALQPITSPTPTPQWLSDVWATGTGIKELPGAIECFKQDQLQEFDGYLDALPWDGDSKNHNKAYKAFIRAASLHIPSMVAFEAVQARIATAGGVVDRAHLLEQLRQGYAFAGVSPFGGKAVNLNGMNATRPKVPRCVFDPDLLRRVANNVVIEDPAGFLQKVSPVSLGTVTPEIFLEKVFKPGDKIILFTTYKSQGQVIYSVGNFQAGITPTSGPDGVWFLVQPVDGLAHFNFRQGKMSARSEESVVRWPFLVLESDTADLGDWLRLLLQLPLPIVAIYRSGGRSIHALVRLDAVSKEHWDAIKAKIAPLLVSLGADIGALTAVRLSRLPQCFRGERLQELLYLNPRADGTPIWNETVTAHTAGRTH